MEIDKAVMSDPILKKIAISVFGEDMVKDAYACVFKYNSSTEDSIYRDLAKSLAVSTWAEIDFHAKDIVITFKNGKTIYVSSSEWGCIRPFDIQKEAIIITNKEVNNA